MKRLRILLSLFSVLMLANTYAAETEPNNTKAQANTLALNGSNTGAIGVAGDEDWWKVTANADGKLNITLNVSNALYLWCQLYDNNGTILLTSDYTSGNKTFSQDGLAAGTYYLKLYAYYAGQLPAYTISNTLTVPAQANDAEPNDSKAQAKALLQNNSKTGHAGFYYNNTRDTADWYKITTNADGRLRLTMASANAQYVYVHLYDNDGTTLLEQGYTNGTAAVVNADGLAAGTYYVKVRMYYTTGFAPYTISDSLFVPAQTNDTEPNDLKEQALTLTLDGSTRGHVGYLFNNKRDTADWYKITTNKDGSLRLTMASANAQYVYVHLYDKDGTTLLDQNYTNGTAVVAHVDGLAAGTYYAKVRCYYSSGFAPYTLSDSLFAYSNATDEEPNKKPYQATTILANKTTEGHVGFYYNNTRDSVDWWKINYTGNNGNLGFTINQEPLKLGGFNYLYFQVYKDTAAAPIYSSYSAAASRQVNLTGLTQGYYWIKVFTYYNSKFSSYSITNSFTQVNVASVVFVSAQNGTTCSDGQQQYKASGSKAPYTIQIYRFGTAYRAPFEVANNQPFTINNLPPGKYSVTAYGDGATGTAFGTSTTNNLIPPATTTEGEANITAVKATLHWVKLSCANGYIVQYRKQGTTAWTQKIVTPNVDSLKLTGLTANTTYQWRVAVGTGLSTSNYVASAYSAIDDFTTSASFALSAESNDAVAIGKINSSALVVYPNPVKTQFTLEMNGIKETSVNLRLTDMQGRVVWSAANINTMQSKKIDVNTLVNGIYMLQVVAADGKLIGTERIVITK